MPEPPTVFVSYSHDSIEHLAEVREISDHLRKEGVDCELDQYVDCPGEGWPRWMDNQIRTSDFVIMICTETYFNRLNGTEEAGVGHGVRWEGNLIYQHFYDSGSHGTKFIPVVLGQEGVEFVPTPVKGMTIYDWRSEGEQLKLRNRLLGIANVAKPELGSPTPLPEKAIRSNPHMFISNPINLDLWNVAGWSAVCVGSNGIDPPILGINFENIDVGKQIFQEWIERFGNNDEHEELRVSIIEGDIPGKEPGYSVHIGLDRATILERYRESGYDCDQALLLTVSRIHRMNPAPESQNLRILKDEYRKHKTYLLCPADILPDGRVVPLTDLGLRKGVLHFRKVEQIGANDEDHVVIKGG